MALDPGAIWRAHKGKILLAVAAILTAVANGTSWGAAVCTAIADLIKTLLGL